MKLVDWCSYNLGKCFELLDILCSSTVCTSATIPSFGKQYAYFMLTQPVHLWICFFMTEDNRGSAWLMLSNMTICFNVKSSLDDVFEHSVFSELFGIWGSGQEHAQKKLAGLWTFH